MSFERSGEMKFPEKNGRKRMVANWNRNGIAGQGTKQSQRGNRRAQ